MNTVKHHKAYIHIYNLKQAHYYIRRKIIPTEIGINYKSGKVYFQFLRKDTDQAFVDWCSSNQHN